MPIISSDHMQHHEVIYPRDYVDVKSTGHTIYIPPAQRMLPPLPHSEVLPQTTNPSHLILIVSSCPMLILPCSPLFRVLRVVSKYVVGLASTISIRFAFSLSSTRSPCSLSLLASPTRYRSLDSHNTPLVHILLLVHPPRT